MKFFVASMLLALAVAEPESQYLGYAGVHPGFYNAHHGGLAHATAGAQVFSNGAVVPQDTYSVKAAKAQHFAAKSVAYANAYATNPLVHHAAYSVPHVAAATTGYLNPHVYSGVYGNAAHYIAKREAESDSESESESQYLTYGGVYGSPALSYANTYATYPAYNAYSTGVYANAAYAASPLSYAYGGVYGSPYTTYGAYGAARLFKREADAEPESQWGRYGYGYAGRPYYGWGGYSSGYGYRGYGNRGYYGYGRWY